MKIQLACYKELKVMTNSPYICLTFSKQSLRNVMKSNSRNRKSHPLPHSGEPEQCEPVLLKAASSVSCSKDIFNILDWGHGFVEDNGPIIFLALTTHQHILLQSLSQSAFSSLQIHVLRIYEKYALSDTNSRWWSMSPLCIQLQNWGLGAPAAFSSLVTVTCVNLAAFRADAC